MVTENPHSHLFLKAFSFFSSPSGEILPIKKKCSNHSGFCQQLLLDVASLCKRCRVVDIPFVLKFAHLIFGNDKSSSIFLQYTSPCPYNKLYFKLSNCITLVTLNEMVFKTRIHIQKTTTTTLLRRKRREVNEFQNCCCHFICQTIETLMHMSN